MSDAEEVDNTQIFIWVLAALVLFTVIVMLMTRSVGMEDSGPMTDKDIDERTKPYSTVKIAGQPEAAAAAATPAEKAPAATAAVAPAEATPVAEAAPATEAPVAAASAIDGQALYAPCAVCHATGVANAPKLGDAAAWAPRVATGMDTMVANAINGKGAMPPKGTRPDYSDAQIRAVVEYMVNASK